MTRYTTNEGSGSPPDGNSGLLVDHSTGLNTPVTLTVSGGQWNGGSHTTSGGLSNFGTDGYTLFEGKADATGVISYGTSDVVLTLSGLNPEMFYTLVAFGNRDRSAYVDRITKTTISGADSFTNESSTGATFSGFADEEAVIANGYNTETGYVAKYVDVDPGDDGEVTITFSDGGSASPPKHYINLLMVEAYMP